MKPVNFIVTSDIHAYIPPEGGRNFIDSITYVKNLYPEAILIDNGDFFSGNLLGTFFNSQHEVSPLVSVANDLGYRVMTPGNHDFDYGVLFLLQQVEALDAEVVCCNIYTASGELLFKPYHIINHHGLSIAVMGAMTGALPQLLDARCIDGLVIEKPIPAIQKYIKQAQAEADVVVLLYHGGKEQDLITGKRGYYSTGEDEAYAISRAFPELDVLVFGHQHFSDYGKIGKTAFVQPPASGDAIGVITITPDLTSLENDIDRETIIERMSIEEVLQHTSKTTKDLSLFVETSLVPTAKVPHVYKPQEQSWFTDYQTFLEQPVDLDAFIAYLNQKWCADYIYLDVDESSVKTFADSFIFPYRIRQFTVTQEKIDTLAEKPGILVQNPSWEEREYKHLLTNVPTLFNGQTSFNYVCNIVDEFVSYQRQNGKTIFR